MKGNQVIRESDRLERAIGRVLWIGVAASSICLGVGLVLALTSGTAGSANLLLNAGLVLLLATPVARVAVSTIDFTRARDWLFVVLTLTVLGQLAASVVAALHGR